MPERTVILLPLRAAASTFEFSNFGYNIFAGFGSIAEEGA
jgi:hypothetical protein